MNKVPIQSVPWPEEQALIEATRNETGGRWVIAAACVDYAYLSDVAAYARVAWGAGSMVVERGAREIATLEYHRLLETEAADRVSAAEALGHEIGLTVPSLELAATAETGNYFIDRTAGHPAVTELMAVLEDRLILG